MIRVDVPTIHNPDAPKPERVLPARPLHQPRSPPGRGSPLPQLSRIPGWNTADNGQAAFSGTKVYAEEKVKGLTSTSASVPATRPPARVISFHQTPRQPHNMAEPAAQVHAQAMRSLSTPPARGATPRATDKADSFLSGIGVGKR